MRGRRAEGPLFGIFGLSRPAFRRVSPEEAAAAEVRRAEEQRLFIERLRVEAEPWNVKGWKPEWYIKTATYDPGVNLFPELLPLPKDEFKNDLDQVPDRYKAVSPSGQFAYVNRVFPAGAPLFAMRGNRKGTAYFDEDVVFPVIFERDQRRGRWTLWMSLTPNEMVTLAPGTRKAKGHTVVAGLGLGHQLIEVCKKRSVTKVTLLERSQELVDWLLPRVKPHLSGCKLRVVVGDARAETGKTFESWSVIKGKGYTLREYLNTSPRSELGTALMRAGRQRLKQENANRARKGKPPIELDPRRHARILGNKDTGYTNYRVWRNEEKSETLLLKLGNQRGVDVVLVDIFPEYGNNNERMELAAPTAGRRPGVVWWAWGGARV